MDQKHIINNPHPRKNILTGEWILVSPQRTKRPWQGEVSKSEFEKLGSRHSINHVQIFENKGAVMGNSNSHHHCQILAQESIPNETAKELKQFQKYYKKNNRSLFTDYLNLELRLGERIVYRNSSFVVLLPFWAVWLNETLIISKRKIENILKFKTSDKKDLSNVLKILKTKYDNIFKTYFPYSMGLHQAPTDEYDHKEWHFHLHMYTPLLRSKSIKKFMVGYEMLAESHRDITPEYSANILRDLPTIHYKTKEADT